MKAELKKRWVEALRSGTYKQGKFVMKNGIGEYCCLGVLCEPVGGNPSLDTSGQMLDPVYDTVREAIGQGGDRAISTLSSKNDWEGATFNDIADYIEATILEED